MRQTMNVVTYTQAEVQDAFLKFLWLHLLETSQQVVQIRYLLHSQFPLLMSSNILQLFQQQYWHDRNGYQMKPVSSFPTK